MALTACGTTGVPLGGGWQADGWDGAGTTAADSLQDSGDAASDAALVDATVCGTACNDGNPCTDDTCNTGAKACVHTPNTLACDDGDACTAGDKCSKGNCVSGPGMACDDGNACTDDLCQNGGCVHLGKAGCVGALPPCNKTAECPQGVCDVANHVCVPCMQHSDCGKSGFVCSFQACVATKACQSSGECKATSQVCDAAIGTCVDCASADDCEAGQSCVQHVCLGTPGCKSDKECPVVCDKSAGKCVGCLQNTDCQAGGVCTPWKVCQPKACTGNTCAGLLFFTCTASGAGFSSSQSCDDGNPCTIDSCSPATGCTHASSLAPCEDGVACTVDDQCDFIGACVGSPSAAKCDDGVACTVDACDSKLGCKHSPDDSLCPNGPCSYSYCTTTGCKTTASDGCGASDVADVDGGSVGDVPDVDGGWVCDTNVDDGSVGDAGGWGVDAVKPCGGWCPPGQFCSGQGALATCIKQTCKDPTFGANLQKISKFAHADPTTGCDLNGDGKVDNAFSSALKKLNFMGQSNDQLVESIADATLVLLLEPSSYMTDGTQFSMNLLTGDAESPDKCPDHTKAGCKYTVRKSSYDVAALTAGFCPALANFASCTITASKLQAGQASVGFALSASIQDIAIAPKLIQVTLSGSVSNASQWLETKQGLICGAILQTELGAAVDAVSDETIAAMGIGDKAALKGLLNALLKPDLDANGDGKNDAISAAWVFESVSTVVTGLTDGSTPWP